jgi:CHAT domain-containing protein/tetratricopeptide (TPR) repeat protein
MGHPMSFYDRCISVSVVAILILLPPVTVAREQAMIDLYKLGDTPLHILPVEEAVGILSQHRYISCSDTQRPVWEIHSRMWERGETENVRYMLRESLRVGMLIQKAFNTDSHLQLAREMMDNEEKNRVWLEVRRRQRECTKRMRERGDLSPEIGKILESNIRDLERVGLNRWMISCYETAADYFFAVEENEKAYDYLVQAYEFSLSTGYHTQTTHLAGRIGKYNERTGDYEAAEKAYSQCLDSAHITGDNSAIARALSFMASLEKKRGRYIDSERLYRKSIEYSTLVEDPICEISVLRNLAELHYSFGYTDRAAYLTQRSILLGERTLGKPVIRENALKRHSLEFYLSGSLSLLARLQHRNGETEEAIRTIRRALDIAEDFADKYYYSGLEKLAGDLHLANGDFRQASRHYDRAMRTIRKQGNRGREAECLVSMADLRIRQGRFGEAEEILREAERTARPEGLWKTLLETEFLRGESAAARDHPDEATFHYERAIAFFDYACPNISYEENKHDVAEKMNVLYSKLLELHSGHYETGDSLLFWAEKSTHRPCDGAADSPRQLDEMIRECIMDRTWIPEEAFVIRYIVTGKCLIGIGMGANGSIHHSAVVRIEDLEEDIGRFFALCNPDEAAYNPGSARIEDTSRKLYRLLIEPFSTSLDGKETVCIIASDPLDKLPFAALYEQEKGFLGEHKRVLAAPSLLHLYRASRSRTAMRDIRLRFTHPLLVGAPEMTPGIRRLFPNLSDIPYAAHEIEEIELLLGGGICLTGAEATPRSFLEHIGRSDLIHIAAHTVQFPLYSGERAFILSTPEEGSSHVESSLLFEDTIRGLDLGGIRLVVLSACESAPGSEAGIATGPGLAGAFYKAGAWSVIATIWPIEDRNASIVMTALYQEMLGGAVDAEEALTTVQRRIIEEDRANGNPLKSIHIWAPYILLSSLEPGS